MSWLPEYAELHCLSSFSFQRGASHPQELVRRASELGYAALAITDECSVAGVVRAHAEARKLKLKLLLGSEFALDGFRLVALARNVTGWGNLCEFISNARREAGKGEYACSRAASDFGLLQDCEILIAPAPGLPLEDLCERLRWANGWFSGRLWLAVELLLQGADDLWLQTLQRAEELTGVPLVAAGDVHMHARSRKPLQDVMTAVRLGKPVSDCGFALQGNAERHLRHRMRLASLYPPELLERTIAVADRCTFSLEEVKYQYPLETVPAGLTPRQALRRFTIEGARQRYPGGAPWAVRKQLLRELDLISDCAYEMYFLTVHDIVRFARGVGILCQGRGSAANSAVCYCLGITAVDPMRSDLLFERFISRERREPPDIDVDFEHERREEVIQYIYRKYGRERSAIAAVVATYRTRSAIRDVGKALGIADRLVDAFAKDHFWFDERGLRAQKVGELAAQLQVDACEKSLALWMELSEELMGFPRHLSQHVGGFVLTQGKLTRLVPVENAAMKDRSVIQWDKDDLDEMGLLKVDVLALGILTAIRRCLDFVAQRRGRPFALTDIPDKDSATYDMICRADTVGVFQIESRAQMSMLPRLLPRVFYDLVIEVAIVRPGPIQGGMIHPYLKARDRLRRGESIAYESEALRPALERTLGIPIFQEQVMQISMIAAGFSADEADQLRRSMAAWKRHGGVHKFQDRLIDGMLANGYRREFAEGIFRQILGFGEYGFPESHAYSFGLLAYDSSWLKCHEPEAFLAAMLNSQPMGFYAPAQLIQDAQRHDVKVLPADVCFSDWDCTLDFQLGSDSNSSPVEPHSDRPPVRLGLRMVGSLGEASGQRIVQARADQPFTSVEDLALRAQLARDDLDALAAADALRSLAGHRRQQVWEATAQQKSAGLLQQAPINELPLELPQAHEGEEIFFDYASLGFTLRRHPVALIRQKLARMKLMSAQQLDELPHNRRAGACGIVTVRQQPQTANGTIFVTLEDETGPVNVIVWKHVRERQRDALLHSRLMAVRGVWQRDVDSGGNVRHLIAEQLQDLTPLLGRLGRIGSSRDFH
ncbi:error-prone DNA polymerase [Ramlibacter ginsenosidimutans]|uniref:Error-prone DNA polymerase n=1 Tax=Ramlibacter ginsenosidimutans TaxID=502333 RepID=A0A934TWC8_9BURK|nr:error-prone DNA polymerase [Ramlibacter ginsenosidimutans]MBK6008535.1 error-prone DNA polymerase [Ramlibacter ginsenosidimutans]